MTFRVGSRVATTEEAVGYTLGGYNSGTATVPFGVAGEVVRSGSNKTAVRFRRSELTDLGRFYTQPTHLTVSLDNDVLMNEGGTPAARTSKYAVPEGDIDPNDPKLAWFWDETSKYADGQSWCPQYDGLLRHFGLPPRSKKFSVEIKIAAGVAITMEVWARSQSEADKKGRDSLVAFQALNGALTP